MIDSQLGGGGRYLSFFKIVLVEVLICIMINALIYCTSARRNGIAID